MTARRGGEDREPVVAVIANPSYRVWALGQFRASISRVTSRRWEWRVWAVLGGEVLGKGEIVGTKNATMKAIGFLTGAHIAAFDTVQS